MFRTALVLALLAPSVSLACGMKARVPLAVAFENIDEEAKPEAEEAEVIVAAVAEAEDDEAQANKAVQTKATEPVVEEEEPVEPVPST